MSFSLSSYHRAMLPKRTTSVRGPAQSKFDPACSPPLQASVQSKK